MKRMIFFILFCLLFILVFSGATGEESIIEIHIDGLDNNSMGNDVFF